jgi:hypothetical protein
VQKNSRSAAISVGGTAFRQTPIHLHMTLGMIPHSNTSFQCDMHRSIVVIITVPPGYVTLPFYPEYVKQEILCTKSMEGPSSEIKSCSCSPKIPSILRKQKVHYFTQKIPQLVPVLLADESNPRLPILFL